MLINALKKLRGDSRIYNSIIFIGHQIYMRDFHRNEISVFN